MPAHPRRNRVTPFGDLEAVPVRGQLMGNRGDLHDKSGNIVRQWKIKGWIACRLVHPRGGRVTFDQPGRYTPLFFADEPTALAAGHRPCAECRREDYRAWQEGWRLAFGDKPSAQDMDATLHAARISRTGDKVTFEARIADLPDGVMVSLLEAPQTPLLLWKQHLHPWTHDGYGEPLQPVASASCAVLTPEPAVAILSALGTGETLPWPGFAAPHL